MGCLWAEGVSCGGAGADSSRSTARAGSAPSAAPWDGRKGDQATPRLGGLISLLRALSPIYKSIPLPPVCVFWLHFGWVLWCVFVLRLWTSYWGFELIGAVKKNILGGGGGVKGVFALQLRGFQNPGVPLMMLDMRFLQSLPPNRGDSLFGVCQMVSFETQPEMRVLYISPRHVRKGTRQTHTHRCTHTISWLVQ